MGDKDRKDQDPVRKELRADPRNTDKASEQRDKRISREADETDREDGK